MLYNTNISKVSRKKIVIILHLKIIFIGHEEKACFAAYPNLENKSQKCVKSSDF